MTVQVLGSGCPTCKKLYDITKTVAESIDPMISVEYITGTDGIKRIIELGSMSSPVIVVDGSIAFVGFTPDKKKIRDVILQTSKKQSV